MLADSLRGFAPTVRGIANSNAKITIKQNGYVIYQNYVAPGPFEISDLYPTSSSGDLKVTVTEADNSESTFTVAYSGVPVLQREGRVKYALTVGQYRTLLNDAIAALRAFDWSSMQELLDDPDISSHLPADVYALLQEAIARLGAHFAARRAAE